MNQRGFQHDPKRCHARRVTVRSLVRHATPFAVWSKPCGAAKPTAATSKACHG
jgi:hypothetical protein